MRKKAEKPEKVQTAPKRKLTRAERKQIEAIIQQAKGDGKPHTVQDSIPFQNLYPDGLCRLDETTFSKTIEYEDVNYRLAGPDDQRDIFERLCDFYNGYDPSIGVQMTLSSRPEVQQTDRFGMAAHGDTLDDLRKEATGILQKQYEKGSNGYVKSKYVTLTIEAENVQSARARFSRIEADTLNRFKVMGAGARVLSGKQRLELLHGLLHPEGGSFAFEWDWLPATGLSVKDFIAPSSFQFGDTRRFRIGEMYGAVSFLQILAPEIQDRILTDFMDTEGNLMVTMHIRGVNQNEAIKMVKRKITDLDAMKIQEQKKAARSGYDMDILPSDLSTYGGAAKNLLQDLQSRNERLFNMTFLILHMAPSKQKLEIAVSQSASVAQTYNCILTRLDFQQEDGLMSSLPIGLNRINIERSLTTSALAVFVPFVTQELFMGGNAMYYGLNALSNNMIMLDRKQSRCPNGLVFGTPGSGKSMSCKREIAYVMLTTSDNIIICDPEDEYSPLIKRMGGQVIRLSPNSTDFVNPLDINLNYSEEENPLALKSDFVLSFCELIMGSKTGLEAIEKTVIDRAVQKIYQPYFADPRPENMPILADLMNALLAQHIPEADRVAQALDLYVNGSLNFFNHRTTVDIHDRLVCFDIKGLGKNLKKPGMLIVQDAVWNTVTVNRAIGRATWYFVDEFHLLLKEEQTAAYSAEIWKRFRKWGGVPTGATQNPKDLLSSPEIENILENSDFIYLLNLSAGDRKLMTERLNISVEQLAYVTNADPGSGLLFFQNVILPFRDEFPKDTELYKFMAEATPASLEDIAPGTDDFTLADTIADDFNLEETVLDSVSEEHAETLIKEAVAALPDTRAAEVIKGCYWENKSLHEIGEQLSISRTRVEQLRGRALHQLRTNRRIKEAAEIYGYSSGRAYHWGVSHWRNTGYSSTEFLAIKHIEQTEAQKRNLQEAYELTKSIPMIADGIRKNNDGYTPCGVRKLEELNAEVERIVQNRLAERKKKAANG